MAEQAYQVGTHDLIELSSRMRGHVTCIEGVDGAGKTTLLRWLQSELERAVKPSDIVMVREPGGTDIGERIRALLLHGRRASDSTPLQMHAMTETLMFFAARCELYDRVILPAIKSKKIVLADRCLYSTIAYQCFGLAPDRDYEFSMEHVLEIAELTLPKISAISFPSRSSPTPCSRPSLCIVLDIDSVTRQERKGGKPDRIESRGDDFLNRVRNGYQHIAVNVPNVTMIPAVGSLDHVKSLCVAALRRFYVPSF